MNKENKIYESIKTIAHEKKLTLADLAKKLEISRQALNAAMKSPSYPTIKKIAGALGVPEWQFFISPEELLSRPQEFIAFVRCEGKTQVFDDKESLKAFCKNLK